MHQLGWRAVMYGGMPKRPKMGEKRGVMPKNFTASPLGLLCKRGSKDTGSGPSLWYELNMICEIIRVPGIFTR